MKLVSYIVYSLREWQVHTQECFHTSVSISGTDDTIHHLLSSPSCDIQCTVQMSPSWEMDSCHHFVLLLWGSGQLGLRSKSTQYTLG